MGVICPNEDVLLKDPKFQALKEAYKDKHFSDKHLANALVLFRQSDSEKYSEDWYPETSAEKDVFTRFINQYLTAKKISKTDSELTQDKIYDLYTTLYSLYSPEKLSARINMISSNFRSFVDQLQKNDTTNRSRLELIKAQADDKRNGFAVILSKIFSMYERFTDVEKMMEGYEKKFPNATETQKAQARKVFEYRANEYKKLLDNKERLAALVAVSVGENEGFMVRVRDFEINLDPYDKDAAISEERNNATTKEGDAEEGSKGDRYVDFRTLDLMSTLSPRTIRLINKIPKVDTDMNILRDDLGMTQYISGRQVAVVLNKVLVNSSPNTLMLDLTDAADYYPWINGLIKVLNINTDYRTDIYDNFKKAESVYLYTDLEDGSYTVKMSNSKSQGKVLMREAGDNMQSGYVQDEKTSIYVGYGSLVSKDKLAKIKGEYDELSKFLLSNDGVRLIKMVDQDKPYSQKYIDNAIAEAAKNGKDISYLKLTSDEAMKTFLEKNPDVAKKIASLLRGMGFNVREKDINAIALQTMTPKSFSFVAGWEHKNDNVGRNKLYQLVRWMGGVYDRAYYILKNSKANEQTGQHLYNTAAVELGHINNTLALSQYQEVEPRVVVEGSSYSAYNNMNLIHQTFDFLANKDHRSEQKYLDDMNDEYLQFEGMAIGKGKSMQVYGWLRRLLENSDNIREKMRVYDMTTFDHKDYAGLTLKQKLTNSLLAFFAERAIASEGYALYEAPISGDYDTAYNFISAPKLSDDELVDEFTNELLLELDRISLIQERLKDDNRVKLSVYEKQGLKIQTFPELNNTGFIETYRSFEDSKEAIDFVRSQVKEQLDNVVKRDIAKLEKEKVFTNKFLKKVNLGYGNFGSFYSAENKFEDLKDDAKDALVNASKNIYYARKQISKLLAGGTEQFNGLGDYEKRNMLSHATRTAMNTNATLNGKRVGKEIQNVVYIEDDIAKSAFLEEYIKPMAQDLKDAGIISGRQYDDMIKAYSEITTTDGQGLRTFESYREVRVMACTWTPRHEDAYQRIIRGVPVKGDIDVFMEGIKPVYTGYEVIPAAAGERQKPVKLTVLHKYSEMVLLPDALSRYCLQTKSVPMQALEEARKQLKAKGKNIDMFIFRSGVKVGAHSILQPFAKDKEGNRILNTKEEIANSIVSGVLRKESTIHTLPFKYYGIAASTLAHVADDKIAWATQAEKEALGNISEGEKSVLIGEEIESTEIRDRYYEIKTAEIVTAYKQLVDIFSNSDELERIFREELATKPYSSYEMQYALAHLKDGTFALPLFSPNIAHEVQQLLASIIKKRITKPLTKGANILQSTGLGMDLDASMFDNANALSEDDKLHIVFEGKGKKRRIKYVEVFMPLFDSRLKRFADETGGIKPETLRDLVAKGIIPEEILNFVAYRTPSDAEHSIIPCRIKGFVANTGGATITMPKEIMVMTGHDYDGDKMRCHFADFEMGWDEEKIRELYDRYQDRPEYSRDIVKAILGDDTALNQIESYESFSRMVKSKNNPSVEAYKKIKYITYDYNKSALENSEKARANAKVELIFSKLTSPDGSRRMLIPGGCNDAKVIAKSLNIVRFAKDAESKNKVAEAIISREVKKILDKNPNMSKEEALSMIDVNKINSIVRNTNSLYESLIRKSDADLTDIIRSISSSESPFSLAHSVEAFDYIMGGAELIAIYAMYNSALQMMQRLDMSYVPSVSQFDNSPYTVSILGTTFGKLFNVKNHKGRLASLGLARLLNAAVDNTKDPVLGYLNQSKEMMGFTFLMFAAGMTEEEIHLFMNQPAVIELTSRLKGQDSENISTEINNIIAEISKDKQFIDKRAGSQYKSLQNVAKMGREDYISHLADSFDDLKTSVDEDFLVQQVSLLQTLAHLGPAASNLETFVKCTRPDSRSGAIGTTLASIVVKKGDLDKFREKLNKSTVEQLHIKGMNEVMKKVDVHDGWDLSYLEDVLDSPLPEVTAMNNLMVDSSLKLFSPYFPQANKSWVELNTLLTNAYKYTGNQREVISRRIGQEMILWKLLSDKKFITGDPQEEQRRIIIDVPKQLKDLKQRIASAKNDPNSKDETAKKLVGNLFLYKLRTTSPENSTTAPRIQFSMNGPALHGQADTIRSHWNALLMSDDKKVVQLAKDLFKYNLYTNGFSYGMYEFFHMTPFSVLLSTENYISALRNVLKSDWSNDADRDNFINQYYRNHWGDSKFLNVYPISIFGKVKFESRDGVRIGKDDIAESWYNQLKNERYIIISSGEGGKVLTPYQVYASPERNEIFLSVATKIGSRNRNQQVTLQYNPTVIYTDVKPVVPGNDSAWGNLDVEPVYTASNYMAAGQRESALQYLSDNDFAAQLAANAFGLSTAKANLEQAEKKADVTSKKNDNILPNLEKSAVLPTSAQGGAFGLGQANPELLKDAVINVSSEDSDKKLYNILPLTDEERDIKEKAVSSGTFMKAPNGKPTNLTEKQWLHVRTKAFKNWFGDWENDPKNASKVVDENGEPLVAYHGSKNKFREFDKFKVGKNYEESRRFRKAAFYFTGTYDEDTNTNGWSDIGDYLYSVFLNIRNPTISKDPREETRISYLSDGVISIHGPKLNDIVVFNPNQIKSATDNSGEFSTENNDIYLSILEKDKNGNYVEKKVPATPQNIREARRQKAFVELNKKLREILRQKGIDIGVLTDAEARMSLGGVTDFETANVTAEGFKELIRLAKGIAGEYALPEEFAHLALEMLGHEHPLVKRLLNALASNEEALKEAFEDQYGEYNERYKENREKMIVEAAGKLLAKNMLREEELSTSKIRRIFARVIDAIKSLLRKFSINEINNAIFDANNISSKIARDLLGGKIVDDMSLENISSTTQYYNVKKDLTDKEDILSKLLKTEVKRLSILQKRNAYGDKDKKPKSVIATEAQIKKLEVSIKNYKTEDAVVTYMRDSVEFLAATQESLKKAVESGRPANWVCGKLNTVRDTLYSFSSSLEDIRQAIIDGEIQDNIGIHESMEKISGVLNILFTEYNKYARLYFEDMLSNIYGEHGKTVTIGKDKGRVITIHEMATRADRDISLASRWFNSLADCNDYALRAIDDLTREAKMKAREKARKIKARIEVAIADLIRETGSRNQDFMFQYELGKDGKMHKTGYYITEEQSKKLTSAKKKFYDTIIDIKNDADRNLPETLLDEGKIVMLRKYTMDRFKDAEGAKGKALEAWEGLKNRVLEMGDIDYEYYEVVKDFEGNRVDMLPVKFLMKGKDESYDDMTDDVATSIMAYAGMAYEYGELDNIIGILENARYMASQRDVTQKTGTRTQRESIVTDDYAYMKPFTIKQAKTNMQNALDDFFQMHVYGHIRANEGTFGKTRLSKRKVVDAINTITSYSQMALNIPQRLSNVTVGVAQIFIESAGRSEYNARDVSWASSIYMRHTADRLADTGKTESDDKLSLWNEYFDIHQDNGRNNEKYKKGWLSRIFNTSLLFAGLTIGEDYLASVTALSLAKNFKMKAPDGKITNLWDAYTVKYLDPANKKGAYLALKKGYKKADGTELTVEDERKFQKKVIGMNFELQGIYNLDDRSAIQQYAFGALIIMYRKWIAPAMRRRYGRTGYSSLKDDYQEGYWRTAGRFLWDSISKKNKDQVSEDESNQAIANMLSYGRAILSSIKLNWSKMNAYEKSNCKKAATEFGIIAGLTAALFLNGKMFPPEEERKDRTWWEKQLLVQALRLKTELGSMAPTLAFLDESLKVLKSPFAAIGPLRDALNIFNLMIPMNYFDTVKSGRFKGHTKAYKFFWELPIISMWKKVDNFVDPTPMINYYNNDSII